MIKRLRNQRHSRKAKKASGPARPEAVIAKAVVFDWLRMLTAPIWFPVVAVRAVRDRFGRVVRQAQVEGAAARRQQRRAKRLDADAADD